ncbi:hypothetical protein N9850_09065 [Granulosicoccus sp.]|nr:hypothetical protein [Granulosicoccus sp.]MDB4223910.1 hypothetical protein [Granulosicoccus sp.]
MVKDSEVGKNNNIVTWLLVFGALSIWFGLGFLTWPSSKGSEPGQYHYIDIDKSEKNPAISSATTLDLCEEKSCESKAQEKNRNQFNREKRDINAQEGMWRAANAVVFLAAIQMLVVAATLWYIRETFKTQRGELSAANLSAESTRKAERPYVFIEPVGRILDRDKGQFRVDFFLRNQGRSPAMDVKYRTGVAIIFDTVGMATMISLHDGLGGYTPALAPSEKSKFHTEQRNFSELFWNGGGVLAIFYALRFYDPICGCDRNYRGLYEIGLDTSGNAPDLTGVKAGDETTGRNRSVNKLKLVHYDCARSPSDQEFLDDLEEMNNVG